MITNSERGSPLLRLADCVVGIPAITALAAYRRLTQASGRTMPANPQVIGLLKASGIGDAVILSGVIADLRQHFPQATLVLFSGESNYAFARLIDGLDDVVALPVRRPLEALARVRELRPDVMIDFGMWPRLEALLSALSGAKWVVGVKTPGQHRHYAFNLAVDHTTEHEITNYRNLVAPFGIESKSMPSFRSGSHRGRPLERRYAILHLWPVGANAAERSWPTERWFQLAQELKDRGQAVVLTGGPADVAVAEALAGVWRSRGLDAFSIAGLPAEETIVWLRHAEGVVSVNTGLMHLAAAVGAPTVALNGPTSGRRWGPLGARTHCVASPMIPEGYLNLGWERDDRFRNCMEAISVDSVIAAWNQLVGDYRVNEELLEASAG